MGMFDGSLTRWLGKPAPARGGSKSAGPNSVQFVASHQGQSTQSGSAHAVRKDLLKMVLRECLQRNGIPEAWLGAELLRASNPKREPGIHVRLLVRQWQPRLLQHAVSLERDLHQRLLLLDPLADNWLTGFSWQFVLEDTSACPPLPRAGTWMTPVAAAEGAAPKAESPVPETAPGDIIAGPVVIPKSEDDVRADLERLLALRDDDVKRHVVGEDGFAPTRPVSL
jgi:hypothetical protein